MNQQLLDRGYIPVDYWLSTKKGDTPIIQVNDDTAIERVLSEDIIIETDYGFIVRMSGDPRMDLNIIHPRHVWGGNDFSSEKFNALNPSISGFIVALIPWDSYYHEVYEPVIGDDFMILSMEKWGEYKYL